MSTVHAGFRLNPALLRPAALAFDFSCMEANLRRVGGKRALRPMRRQAYGQVALVDVLFGVHDISGTHITRCTAEGQRVLPLTKWHKSPRVRGKGALLG